MVSPTRTIPRLLRDTVVAATVFAILLAPIVFDVGPDVLDGLGTLFYVPLVVVFSALGGELENANGPGALFFLGYVLALGFVAAVGARFVRRHVDMERLASVRFAGSGLAAIAGSLGILYGLGALGGILHVGTSVAVVALVVGIGCVGGALVLAAAD